MRIALFHNLSTGGGKRHLYEQARELVARGHTLELFAPASAAGGEEYGEYLPLAPLCQQVHCYGEPAEKSRNTRSAAAAPVASSGLRERAKATPLLRDMLDALWAARMERKMASLGSLYARMASDIDAGNFDVVYVHHCILTLAPDLLRCLRRTPSVFCCHDTQRSAMEWPPETPEGYDTAEPSPLRQKRRGRLLSPAQSRFADRQERRFVANTRAADIILANSGYSREALARGAGVNARICYPGVDTEWFCPNPDGAERERLVVSVGALLPTKRHGFVLDAIAEIPLDVRPRLEIIGYEGGPQADQLAQHLCARAEIAGVALTVRRDVSDTDLREAYRRASVVAFAPYLEPFGLAAVEAMACGTPVVGVCEGGVRETVRDGETGLLTDLDPEAFGAAIAELLTNPERTHRLGAKARQVATLEWTWKRSVDRLEPILTAAARRGKAN